MVPPVPQGRLWGIWGAIIAPYHTHMQAILTRYLGPTNCRGARIKAECYAESIVIPYPHELSGEEVHRAAALALIAKINRRCPQSPWPTEFVTGCLPSGDCAHVFTL